MEAKPFCHFSYDDSLHFNNSQLFQGDVLERTDYLLEILREFYPYPHDNPDKYPYFLVLTQSCDLVPREGRYNAEHITIAAVRHLRYFLTTEVQKLQTEVMLKAGVCFTESKQGLIEKLERLLSNELPPYFYIHHEGTPLDGPHVAYLRITFPIDTYKHYEKCADAKILQLCPVFRAKLGWLTTLVFGRVATEDFNEEIRSGLAKDYVESGTGVQWRRKTALKHEAKRQQLSPKLDLSEEEVEKLLRELDKTTYIEQVVDVVMEVIEKTVLLDKGKKALLRSRLLKNTHFRNLLPDS